MSVRRSLIWSYASQAVSLVVTFTTSVIVARILAPRDLGVYALGLAVAGVLSVFLTFSIQAYLVREKELDARTIRSAFTVNFILTVTLSLFLAGAGLIQLVRDERDLATVFIIMAIGPLFSALEFIPAALLMREMRYGIISAIAVLRALVTAGVTLGLVWAGSGAPGLAAGPVVANLVCAITFMTLRRSDLVLRPGFYQFRTILTFGAQMISISGLSLIHI